MSHRWSRWLTVAGLAGVLAACGAPPWNNPYPQDPPGVNSLYASFNERPKHLDPARSYSSNEYAIISQIYEPLFQYHFLLRPYQLVPLLATRVPVARLLDDQGRELPADAPPGQVAVSEYALEIRSDAWYQPHPALARDAAGHYLYHHLKADDLASVHRLADFPQTGTRQVTAADLIYQIKRLAAPWNHCPIAGVIGEYLIGFNELSERLRSAVKQGQSPDLRQESLTGVEQTDDDHYVIRLKGKYPQFPYWLAMPFFAPMPWEAIAFYDQPGLKERNISLDWYPIGSGPYYLTENNPNLRMVLERNPHFHPEAYPGQGMPEDAAAGLLQDAGRLLPLIDRVVFNLEKETIPYWNKFLQGYFDNSAIASDSFDQAVRVGAQGQEELTPAMQEKGIRLETAVQTAVFYLGFNMRDPVVGGLEPAKVALRQAISLAIDYEEFIAIFNNGRGLVAQGPLPPGIFGARDAEAGMNPVVYDWVEGAPRRKAVAVAEQLMIQAGYPQGRGPDGQPLVLYFDTTGSSPDDKQRLSWYRKQLARLGIELVIRSTDYNRFQEKMRNGGAQLFIWGWNADYPDPENFLFLLYGPNAKVGGEGENAANYENPQFDRLFERMKNLDNGPERQQIIDQMVAILRHDAPWVWGFFPKSYALHHRWYANAKPNLMANNTLKYKRLDPELRDRSRLEWNHPARWPWLAVLACLIGLTVPGVYWYRRREWSTAR